MAASKVREAKRNLFPAATLKTSLTQGTASELDFREYSSGLELQHPLYYSGRLRDTYRQSLVNLMVAEKRQGKVKGDFSLELAQAYFQLVGAKAGFETQEGLVKKAQGTFDAAQARYQAGLLTRLELLNVESLVNQSRFQQQTAENDVTLARLKFLQRLGVEPDQPPPAEVPGQLPPTALAAVDPEEALQLALLNRLDIKINTLQVEFSEYEERIALSKGKLKLDLTGFIGASASAFETEPLNPAEDYFVGLRATRTWGSHGMTSSVTDTHTSPRLGQTTRTDSTVYQSEVGLFNQLSGLTEVEQARANLERARHELAEIKQTIFQEVQESYVSFTKARLQLEYARQKIQFRKEQVKVLEAQASLNEVPPSQVLEALIKETDEEVGFVQAQTNYHVALARLNKAVGLPGHYS